MKNTKSFLAGGIIVAAALLLVLGRWQWVCLNQSAGLKAALELGSVAPFWSNPEPNQDHSKLVFGRRSEQGVSFFLLDLATGQQQLVCSLKQNSSDNQQLRLLGWAPDDKTFGYARNGRVYICDGKSGANVEDFQVGGTLREFAWLSPSSVMTLNTAGTNRMVQIFDRKKIRGKKGVVWTNEISIAVGKVISLAGLTRLKDETAAWRQDGEIWTLDRKNPIPKKIWTAGTNSFQGFDYSKDTGLLLIKCGINRGTILGLNPDNREPAAVLAKLGQPDAFVFRVSAVNSGAGFAYLSSATTDKDFRGGNPSKNNTLFVQKDTKSPPMQVLGNDGVVNYTQSGNTLFIIGQMTNEPCALWKYDTLSGSLERIYSPLPRPVNSTFVASKMFTTTNELGHRVVYELWAPVKMSGKKAPLVICQSLNRWMAEAQIAANLGCYFARAHRDEFHSARMSEWCEDVLAVQKDLASNPSVDTRRVYLFATSAEAGYASRLMTEHPELWKGAFLSGATGPSLDAQHRGNISRIVIVVGSQDDTIKYCEKYLETAARTGLPVKLVQRWGGHTDVALSSVRTNNLELARLLLSPE